MFWNTFARSNSTGERIGGWNLNTFDENGQCLRIDESNNINVVYCFSKDHRQDKNSRVPHFYHGDKEHCIARWNADILEKTINNKFNNKGFYICRKNKEGYYNKISFGAPISFEKWLESFKTKKIYYDGYSKLTGRWRGCFRASKTWWNNFITEEY